MELLDIYDNNGNVTGRKIVRGDKTVKLNDNEHIALSVIFIENDNIEEYGFLNYDKPLRYMYYINKNIDINDIKTQKEEVDYVEYMNIDKINELIENGQMLESHAKIFKEIMEKRKEKRLIK